MTQIRALLPADVWLNQPFSSRSACDGGIVRRSVRDVERIVGRGAFARELHRRGYHAVENPGQFVVFYNNEPVHLWCWLEILQKDF